MSSRLPVVSGGQLVRLLERLGYEFIGQRGSHIRMRKDTTLGEHSITIPAHQEGVTGIAMMANTHVQKEFSMNSGQDGIVKLKIRDNGGQNGVWIINGLEVTRQ